MFRYRRLMPHGPRDTKIDGDTPDYTYEVGSAMGLAVRVAGGVQEVAAEEKTADFHELVGLLRDKTLMPSDLVFSEGLWRSFADAKEFEDTCHGLVDTRALKAKVRSIVLGLAIMIGSAILVYWYAFYVKG